MVAIVVYDCSADLRTGSRKDTHASPLGTLLDLYCSALPRHSVGIGFPLNSVAAAP